MTKIEKLEAEIADYKKELQQLEDEIKFLKLYEEKKKSYEDYPRVGKDETYYSVAILGKGNPRSVERQDKHKDEPDFTTDDAYSYKHNNYFKSEIEADKMVNAIKFLFKLQRFYDIYCPNYKPDWYDNTEHKYAINFDHNLGYYVYFYVVTGENPINVYFPTEEIAKKICNTLNEEYD